LQGIIDEHRRTLDPENPKDFLDSILIDSEKENDISVSILHILLDTFVGGTDTSSNTIEFLIGYLANHPDIQRKVHEELDSNVKGRCPTIDDESNLPYLCAALKEAMRIAPVAAVLVRRANEDMYLRGYKIPKGYRTICLAHALGHDPDLWKNPEEFRPERFLEEDKDVSLRGAEMPKNRDHLKATFFGLGKRACAGYQLARKELFLQAAYYLWAFEFSTPTPNQKLDLTMLGGLVAKAKTPVIVRAKYRQSMKS
jgi:cytochrome P450